MNGYCYACFTNDIEIKIPIWEERRLKEGGGGGLCKYCFTGGGSDKSAHFHVLEKSIIAEIKLDIKRLLEEAKK